MTMATTQTTIAEVRSTLETIGNLSWTEGSIGSDEHSLMGAIDMNLSRGLNERDLMPILRAIYCLGKMNDRFLALAGDIPGTRCKNRQFRQDYRSYAEVAKELAIKLEELVVEGVSY